MPPGLAIGAVSAVALVPQWGVVYAAVMVMILSVGFALTQPLFAGIVTDLGGRKRVGEAMGINVFLLFTGFGAGAFIFSLFREINFTTTLSAFAGAELLLALGAIYLFRGEVPQK